MITSTVQARTEAECIKKALGTFYDRHPNFIFQSKGSALIKAECTKQSAPQS
jgi:hypothetical protein